METLKRDEPEKYQSQFSEYIKRGIEPEYIEELYKKMSMVHAAVGAYPTIKHTEKDALKVQKHYLTRKLLP